MVIPSRRKRPASPGRTPFTEELTTTTTTEARAEHVLLVLEGANALLPVLGVGRTVDGIRDMMPAVVLAAVSA